MSKPRIIGLIGLALVGVFPAAWLIAAKVDLGQDRQAGVYLALELQHWNIPGQIHRTPLPPSFFTIDRQRIVERQPRMITYHENCTITDIANWTCSQSKGMFRIGFSDGIYWERFPPMAGTRVALDPLQYYLLLCRWGLKHSEHPFRTCLQSPFQL